MRRSIARFLRSLSVSGRLAWAGPIAAAGHTPGHTAFVVGSGKEQSDTTNMPLRRGFDLYIELPGQILLELELKECSAPVGDHIDSCVFGESADGCYRSSLR